MRRFATGCLLIMISAACGSDVPEIHPPDQMVTPSAFDAAPSLSLGDSTLTPPGTDPPDPTPTPAPVGQCDPNYSPCVPIDSDVDCEGHRGNGPSYARGPVRVVGRDVYGLDRDGDGIGCES